MIPRGANAQIVIRSATKGGHVQGRSDLVMDLASVSIEEKRYELNTRDIVKRGKSGVGTNARTAKFTGAGAAIGAIVGAIAGHGKGAAIGSGRRSDDTGDHEGPLDPGADGVGVDVSAGCCLEGERGGAVKGARRN